MLLLNENKLVYPATTAAEYWDAKRSPEIEDVEFIDREGTRIHAWWLPCPGATGALLYCHGNGGNLSMRGELLTEIRERLGVSVLIFDYPGYGKSEGSPSEAGCYASTQAAYDWLVEKQHVDPHRLILYGVSLGGGMAIELGSRKPHRALIVAKTFTSLPDVASVFYPWVPVHLLMRNRCDSLARIGGCHEPTFVAHGDLDQRIPIALGRKLFEAAPGPKEFFTLEGMGHNETLTPLFFERVKAFLDRYPPKA